MLGAFDRDSLMARGQGSYERGVFDLGGDLLATPRPIVVAEVAREIGAGGRVTNHATNEPGWWERPDRLIYPVVGGDEIGATPAPPRPPNFGVARRPRFVPIGRTGETVAR